MLDDLPGRSALEARLRPLMEVGAVSAPAMRGNRYFFSKREGAQNQPVIYWREGYRGADARADRSGGDRSDRADDRRMDLAVARRPARSRTARIAPATRTRRCT